MTSEVLQQTTIMIVEDDSTLREIIADIFKDLGCTVIKASSGREAISLLRTKEVDLILSDIRMPDGDGMFLLRFLQANISESPPLIFISGGSKYTEAECLESGAKKVLPKPCDRKILVETILDTLKTVAKSTQVA